MTTFTPVATREEQRLHLTAGLLAGAWLVAMFVLLAALLSRPPYVFNIDVAYHLTVGERVLNGQRQYLDFEDNNLPMINYLSAIAVGLAPVIGVNIHTMFNLLVLALIVLSVGMSHWAARGVLPGWQTTAILAALLTTLNLHLANFGQREYLFTLMIVPWLFLRWRRMEDARFPVWGAVAIGLLAGTGTAIKPFFLAPLLLPELAGKARLGILAGVDWQPEVEQAAQAAGLYTARIHDEMFELTTRSGFAPRRWG